jgi:hypothetical protein
MSRLLLSRNIEDGNGRAAFPMSGAATVGSFVGSACMAFSLCCLAPPAASCWGTVAMAVWCHPIVDHLRTHACMCACVDRAMDQATPRPWR